MVQHLGIRAARMQHLEALDEVGSLPSESLGNMLLVGALPGLSRWELGCYFLFAEGVVLKLLSCLATIHRGHEHIVKTKLAGEHVHHDVYDAFIMSVRFGCPRTLVRKSIQDIYKVLALHQMGKEDKPYEYDAGRNG